MKFKVKFTFTYFSKFYENCIMFEKHNTIYQEKKGGK